MSDHYILDGRKAVKADLIAWAKWFETTKDRHVARETIGDADISTVFLGLDHSFGQGPPLLFETMVFGGALDQEQERCTTWEEAEAMHTTMCERVRTEGAKRRVEGARTMTDEQNKPRFCALPLERRVRLCEWKKFTRSLNSHPGVAVAFAMNGMGAIAGAMRVHEPTGIYGAVFGFAVTCIFWIPVVWTAWTGRNGYDA